MLLAVGNDSTCVVKIICFLTKRLNVSQFDEVYAKCFSFCRIRWRMAIKVLPKEALVKVESIEELI